jgi:hypothetical protein
LISAEDLNIYINGTESDISKESGGHDVASYLRQVNRAAGHRTLATHELTANDLKTQTRIVSLNPYRYLAIWTLLVRNLWSGEDSFQIPMIGLGGVRYLPAVGFELTPFGSQYRLDNLFAISRSALCITIRVGDPTFHQFWGVGFRSLGLWKWEHLGLDLEINVWDQPSLLLGGKTVSYGRCGLGGSTVFNLSSDLGRRSPSTSLVAGIGYKTDGFLGGETLRRGLIFRAGISLAGD